MMERLTEDNFRLGFDDSNKLPSYESIYERLREYEKLEDQGTLLKLPCKPGDTVYILVKEIEYIHCIKVESILSCVKIMKKIGKTVFLTKNEAQKALEKFKNERRYF